MPKKYKWYVRLICRNFVIEQTVLTFLATCLKEPACTILKKDGNYYLVSSDFEVLTDGFDILHCARKKFDFIENIISLKFNTYMDLHFRPTVEIDDVYQFNKDGILVGEKTKIYGIEDSIPAIDVLKTMNAQSPTLSELWIVSQSHPEIEEALHYYGRSYDWINLYKIYEVIKMDIGKSENARTLPYGTFSKWTQGRKLDFEQSAHNAYISGKSARHSFAGSRKVSGVNPMSLQEAKKFIENLFLEWVKTKI